MEQIQLLIADDNEPFRRGLRAMLRSELDILLIGEASDGMAAVAQAESLQPDVVLMDLQMPSMSGLEATRRILSTSPHIRVLVLTMSDDDESVFAALRLGARGYLLKGTLKADMLRAIRAVHNGDAIFGPGVALRLIHYFSTTHPPAAADVFPELTVRERQILDFLAAHRSNQEIADILVLSHKTVRNHISNICTKLQVAGRAEAIIKARDAGLG